MSAMSSASPTPIKDPWLSTRATALLMGRSVKSVRQLVKTGRLKAKRDGTRLKVRRSDAQRFMNKLPEAAASNAPSPGGAVKKRRRRSPAQNAENFYG